MDANYQIPFIVTFMFVIFPLASLGGICCYYKWAMKKEDTTSNNRGDS